MTETRVEEDFLGEMAVPTEAYYGIQTWRAAQNFQISGLRSQPIFNRAFAEIKKAAALVHCELGELEPELTEAIVQAADEVIDGQYEDQFVVDVFQAGAGTSHHMNVNELLANRAAEILGGERGTYDLVHPNDDVNMGQSTNDVFPTAMRIAALLRCVELVAEMRSLADEFRARAREFSQIGKSGRTHLQDAVPIKLGHEFGAYADAVAHAGDHVREQMDALRTLGIGGSAAGTGLNTHEGYREKVVDLLSKQTGLELRGSDNLFEAMQSMAPFTHLSGSLRSAAVELNRISNDLRLLSSGPTTGLGEIRLPAVQPGSSIMPGKVNPVIPECMNMICFQVIGNDSCISHAAEAGQMELNVMMPIIKFNILWSLKILTNGCKMLRDRCVEGVEANEETCQRYLDSTIGLATVLNPVIGYHQAGEIAREAARTGRTIREIVLEKDILSEEEFNRLQEEAAGTTE